MDYYNKFREWQTSPLPLNEALEGLFLEFTDLINLLAEREGLRLGTLFAKLSFLANKLHWDQTFTKACHHFRLECESQLERNVQTQNENLRKLGWYVLLELTSQWLAMEVPEDVLPQVDVEDLLPISSDPGEWVGNMRFVALEWSKDRSQVHGIRESKTTDAHSISFDKLEEEEQQWLKTYLGELFSFPVILHLHETVIVDDVIYPGAVVIEPDYLIDITAISECFKPEGAKSELYLLRKLYPGIKTKHLLLGNMANYLLDELIVHPNTPFRELFVSMFKRYPLEFAAMSDAEVMEIMYESKIHYSNLRRVIKEQMNQLNIASGECQLEPSFYSNQYGIQGRLDVFYANKQEKNASIIELKSGKTYKPNAYGLNANHYTQTLLYDLLVKSVFGRDLKTMNYILYSKIASNSLRYAPVVKARQAKAMRVRNKIMAIEYQLTRGRTEVFELLDPDNFGDHKGFIARDLKEYRSVWTTMDHLDRSYYQTFVSFLAREHHLAKVGTSNDNGRNGLASIWLNTTRQKLAQFDILLDLVVERFDQQNETPIIHFRRPSTESLSNFRTGDIAVIYPSNFGRYSALKNQVYKCSVLSIEEQKVVVRLRSRQTNDYQWNADETWSLEHDVLDSSFKSMFHGLYEFFKADHNFRSLIYGKRRPEAIETPG